jgi:hypothetical protein
MSTTVKKKSAAKSTSQDSPRMKIIPMDWVDFHVFQWICHSDDFDVDKLVAQAVANAEATENSSIEQQLEILLDAQVEEWLDEWVGRVGNGMVWSAEEVEPLVFPDSPIDPELGYEDLVVPILKYSWDQISTWKVTEAILRHKGMWRK